jgi:hypothetical protein
MKKKSTPTQKPAASKQSTQSAEVKNAKEKAEPLEVAGRHKNDGQMAHKGAR